ncbi:protein mesh-like [Bradysia coprophila]|uniref:protein mesh-like n=1 Tax=Bradysia coprophila TaxID=38358 RepID=UPI00187DDA60|nr:protein mesh-like [Bradysia coprophila]
MYALLLLVVIASFEGSAEVIRTAQIIGYEIGGSQISFSLDGFAIGEMDHLKCVLRFHDRRDSIEMEPYIPRDRLNAICRLSPEINAGRIDIDLVVTTSSTSVPFTKLAKSTNTAILSKTLFVDPIPKAEIRVVENWDANQVTLTWSAEYFAQFFKPGAVILMQLNVYVANSFDPDFETSQIVQLVGQNSGSATVTLSAANAARFSNVYYPYFYVLRPIGTQSDIFLASLLFAPTLSMDESSAERTCSNWLKSANVPISPDEIHPCPPCLCQVELDTNFVPSEYPPQLVELANGTLNDHVLYYERVPTQSGYAQSCSYNRSTRNLATTSPAQAGWIHYLSKHISYEHNYFSDIWPYMVCCLQSNSQEYCDLFHEKRPINTGHEYPGQENPCIGWGDPHMQTFESVKYDFMGHGEFWLIRGPEGSEFGVQGRMSPSTAGQLVSFYKAVAVRDGNTTVQIEKRAGALIVLLNKLQLRFSTLPVSFPMDSVYLVIDSDRVEVRFQSGFSITVVSRGYTYVDVYGRAARYNKGKGFMGIFGNFDDNSDNDLTSQDGFVIPPTAENLRDLSLLHHRFGLTWLVNRTESFFVYEDGKSWDDFVNVSFGPIVQYPDPATLPQEVREICGDSLFCYYEYVGTDSLEQASEAVRKETAFDELRKEMERKIPMCETLGRPANGRVQVNGYLDGALATYSCNREYDVKSGDRVRTCSASEELSQWTGVEPVCIWTCTTCLESMEFELSHDPSDCTKFFLCSFGERFSLDCPISQSFDPEMLFCSADHNCSGTPSC